MLLLVGTLPNPYEAEGVGKEGNKVKSEFIVKGIDIGGKMIENISWVFFDIGSTIINEQFAYEHRFKEIAEVSKISYDNVYQMAISYYKQNKKGDLEVARAMDINLATWHNEDEVLYDDVPQYLKIVKKNIRLVLLLINH